MPSSALPHKVLGTTAEQESDPESKLSIAGGASGKEDATLPRSTDGKKRKAHMDQVGPSVSPHLCHDGGKPTGLGKKGNRCHLPQILLGRIRSVRSRKMHGRLAVGMQTNRAGRDRNQRLEARRLRPADTVALASKNRRGPGLEPTADPNVPPSASFFQGINIHGGGEWTTKAVMGKTARSTVKLSVTSPLLFTHWCLQELDDGSP